jgi:hypothetical protein
MEAQMCRSSSTYEMSNAYKILENLKGRDHLRNMSTNGRIILIKCIKINRLHELYLCGSGQGTAMSSCENGNEQF